MFGKQEMLWMLVIVGGVIVVILTDVLKASIK